MLVKGSLQEMFHRIKRPNNLYDSLLPVYIFTKCIGLCPYSYVKIVGKPKYVPSTFGSVYSISIILLFVGYYIYQVEQSESAGSPETNKIAKTIDIYQIYGGIVIMTISVIANCFSQKTLTQAIQKITDVDNKLNASIDYKSRRNVATCHIIIVLVTFAILEYMNCSMYLRQVSTLSTYCFVMCYLPMILNAFVELQFITFITIIKERFLLLNQELFEVGKTRRKWKGANIVCPISKAANRPCLQAIRNVRKAHAVLCGAGIKINRAFSLQMLLNTAHIFITFTTLGYYCFDGAMKLYLQEEETSKYNTLTTGVWTFFKILQLLLITLACSVVKNEANLASKSIFTIKERFEPEVSYEINAFVRQIMHWNFKFTAFHLFDLDMELFYSAVSASATYLMILLQLDIANRQLEQSFKLITNETSVMKD